MRLWSIWDEERYGYFQEHGFLVTSWEHVEPYHERAYRWLARHVPRRSVTGMPDTTELRPPVWAWAVYGGVDSPAPDLTDECHLPTGTPGYCLELSVPREAVLLSQFELWIQALNGGFVIADGSESDRLETASAGWSPSEQQRQKEQTWLRMFDLEYGSDDYWGPRNERMIQACLQCIVAADVVNIERFTAV